MLRLDNLRVLDHSGRALLDCKFVPRPHDRHPGFQRRKADVLLFFARAPARKGVLTAARSPRPRLPLP
eukprot:6196380-Pleurochrysis_carterae.AAC.3